MDPADTNPPNMFQESYDFSSVKAREDLTVALNAAWKDFYQKHGAYPNVWLLDMEKTMSLQAGYYAKKS